MSNWQLFEGLSLKLPDYRLQNLRSLQIQKQFFSGPGERAPQYGRQLLETFLDHPDLGPGMRYQLRLFIHSIRTSRPRQDKAQASRMWKEFVLLEHEAYTNIRDRSPFQAQTADGMKDIGPCRYLLVYLRIYTS